MPEENNYLYCKVFTTAPEVAVKALLVELLGGEFDRHTMDLTSFVVEVRRNPDAYIHTVAGDEFLGWPILVELEEGEDAESAMVEVAAEVISALWTSGHKAVAACDFEDELPWKGGIERLSEGE
ncbi:hypothetical protein [Nonomuraea sp. NPDC049158]|uniref:hypothetical protein n=1 Tax=Nonomuraea sp. NPDC049158 TaxID=3155649 RepID=UPI00340316AD